MPHRKVENINQSRRPFADNLKTGRGFITDGVGARQYILKTGLPESCLSACLLLPSCFQVSCDLKKYIPYNYGGFEYVSPYPGGIGSWTADMGLQLYNNLGPELNSWGWKPILILKQKTSLDTWSAYEIKFLSDGMEGTWHNGYKPGSALLLCLWYNCNGKVRMLIDGVTICPTRHGIALRDTHNVTICETVEKCDILEINKWKLLSTVVSDDNTGKNKALFWDIRVDEIPVPGPCFPPGQEDQAWLCRWKNNLWITVDSDIY